MIWKSVLWALTDARPPAVEVGGGDAGDIVHSNAEPGAPLGKLIAPGIGPK